MRQFEEETIGELSKRTQTIYIERNEVSQIRTEGEKETELKKFLLSNTRLLLSAITRLDLKGQRSIF